MAPFAKPIEAFKQFVRKRLTSAKQARAPAARRRRRHGFGHLLSLEQLEDRALLSLAAPANPLAFVDARVPDQVDLRRGMLPRGDASPRVYVVDPTRDGFAQVA